MHAHPEPDDVPASPAEIKAHLRSARNVWLSPRIGRRWIQACTTCGEPIVGARKPNQQCSACRPPAPRGPDGPHESYYGHLTQDRVRRQTITLDARLVMADRVRECQRCGYDLFVDVCHIRPVRAFPPTALVREINAPENLLYLCPNCHRELDAGMWIPGQAQRARYVEVLPKAGKARWSSPYRGVDWMKGRQRWRATIMCQGKRSYLGSFVDEHNAARAYNSAATRLFGDRAILNELP